MPAGRSEASFMLVDFILHQFQPNTEVEFEPTDQYGKHMKSGQILIKLSS